MYIVRNDSLYFVYPEETGGTEKAENTGDAGQDTDCYQKEQLESIYNMYEISLEGE